MNKKLKLFVWEGFSPDWTDGLAFAIAHDESEARMLVEGAYGFEVRIWGKLSVLPMSNPVAFCVSGGG